MRPRPVSKVVKTDDEIRKEMASNATTTKAEISAVMDDRKATAEAVQAKYDKGMAAPYDPNLSVRSSGAPTPTYWDKK